jgi:hypothetical protein
MKIESKVLLHAHLEKPKVKNKGIRFNSLNDHVLLRLVKE